MRTLSLVGLVLTAALIAGCSRPVGQVHGTVSLDQKPLTGGTIILLPEDNKTYPAPIGPDGKYTVTGVPYGRVRVAVVGEERRVVPKAEPKKGIPAKDADEMRADDEGKKARQTREYATAGIDVPEAYADPAKSGLAFEMDRPEKEFPVELKK